MTKNQIRIEMRQLRNHIAVLKRNNDNTAIRKRLFKTEEYKSCIRLFTFISFQSEVDTIEIINQALQDQKKVYAPRVEGNNMDFYEINHLDGLIPSKYGVPEPSAEEIGKYHFNNEVPLTGENLMLLPGLAFDKAGNRIGYGAGYYDRYLAAYPPKIFYKVALAYDFQLVDTIPSEEYDIKADMILLPSQVIRCNK